jgi:hypothetical protein
VRDEFMITRQGKQYVLFQGLLDEAHTQGLRGIDTELLQVPDPDNGQVAIVKAVCEMEDGRKFSGIGDASPDNVGRNIAPHVIRMAETRAKARALRDAVNVGATALEELSEGDDAPPTSASGYGSRPSRGSDGANARSRPTPIRGASGSRQDGRGGEGQGGQQRGRRNAPAPEPEAEPAAEAEAGADAGGQNGQAEEAPPAARKGGSRAGAKARKSQVDLLRTLAVEWAGDGGVERLEGRVGKPLADLTRAEADEWIDRLTPEGRE